MYLCRPKWKGHVIPDRPDVILNLIQDLIRKIPNQVWNDVNDEKCGEIWLLATTLKNAKMLNMVINMMIRFHINVLCFCDGSAFMWGFIFILI